MGRQKMDWNIASDLKVLKKKEKKFYWVDYTLLPDLTKLCPVTVLIERSQAAENYILFKHICI